jgi:hypothetical protein
MIQIFATNMNGNFTTVKQLIWLLLMEMENEVEDVTKCALIGHCGTFCVKCLHHIKYCCVVVCLLFVSVGK